MATDSASARLYQITEVEDALKLLAFDVKTESPSGTIIGPGLDLQSKCELRLDVDVLLCKDPALVDVIKTIDELSLDVMLARHSDLFPASANMTSADVDSLFNPAVKRRGEVRFPLASDVIIRNSEGDEVSRADLSAIAVGDKPQIEFILEFGGFCVDTTSFAPIITVSEIAILPPDEKEEPESEKEAVVEVPAEKRRVPRLVIRSKASVAAKDAA